VGAVSYLNTKPLVYGFEKGMMQEEIVLTTDYPSRIAQKLLDDEIDIGLVPVAIIPRMKEAHITTDFCIGSNGPVASVCLFSDVPLENVENILLDYQSRTSVQLAKILLKEYWKLQPLLTDAKEDFREHIEGTTAGLVIGDRALEQRKKSAYIYDLGEAWKNMTGKSFLFAAWISNKKLPEHFIQAFNSANQYGLSRLDEVVDSQSYSLYDLHKYYTENISYQLDRNKKEGLNLFLEKIREPLKSKAII